VMLVGRLFHAGATVTRNDRSPMVLSWVRRTIRRGQEPDRSQCRDNKHVFDKQLSKSLCFNLMLRKKLTCF